MFSILSKVVGKCRVTLYAVKWRTIKEFMLLHKMYISTFERQNEITDTIQTSKVGELKNRRYIEKKFNTIYRGD